MEGHGGASIEVELPLRQSDVDSLGHVNQAVYHALLEELRSALFASVLETSLPEHYVLARVEVDYLHEIRLRDHVVRGVSCVVELGHSRVVTEDELLLPDGTLAARARSTLVAWDPRARGSRPLGDVERQALLPGAGTR